MYCSLAVGIIWCGMMSCSMVALCGVVVTDMVWCGMQTHKGGVAQNTCVKLYCVVCL